MSRVTSAMARDDNYDNIEAETTFEIQLYIYDMTKGMAKMFSQMFLGKFVCRSLFIFVC